MSAVPDWIFWVIAYLVCFGAFFLAWRYEHRARIKMEAYKRAVEKL